MELLVALLVIGVFALTLSNRSLAGRLGALERRLDEQGLRIGPAPAPHGAPIVAPGAAVPIDIPVEPYGSFPPDFVAPPPNLDQEVPPEPSSVAVAPREPANVGALFENLVGGRLLIWVGGIALVVAAIFLIRYSIEIGLITPELRMIAAGLFGLALVIGGEVARARPGLADEPRVAQALVGAGIAVLYATAYGSHILYGFIGAGTASALMLAITGGALALSLRHGAPTAVMGLVGGFLTPLLVGDPGGGAVPLLFYLALLNAAIFVIAGMRGWGWIVAAAVLASFGWTAVLLTEPVGDAAAAGLFVLLLAIAAAFLPVAAGRRLPLIQPLVLAGLQLAVLVGRSGLDGPAWLLFGALSAAALALAWWRPVHRPAAGAVTGLMLAILLVEAGLGFDPLAPLAAIGLAALFGGAGAALALRRRDVLWTAIACAGVAGPAIIMRACQGHLLLPIGWAALLLGGAAALAALAWSARERAAEGRPDPTLLLPSLGTVLLAAIALADVVRFDALPAAWLALAAAVGFAARRVRDHGVAVAALAAALVACLWGLGMVPELFVTIAWSLAGVPALAAALPAAETILWALVLPAALLALLQYALPPFKLRSAAALPVIATVFAIAAAYGLFKQAFGLADGEDFVARAFLERAIITQALFAVGWLLASGRLGEAWSSDAARRTGRIVTALAAARLIWFDLLLFNPVWTAQAVGSTPIANLLLPAFIGAAAWLYVARGSTAVAAVKPVWFAGFLVALLAGAALLTRQLFQGSILSNPGVPTSELYAYSVTFILLSIGMIAAGIRLPDRALRIAGLVLLTLTIIKVFLVDASALEGLLRILSFLGLGASLIVLGRYYGTLLRAERAAA